MAEKIDELAARDPALQRKLALANEAALRVAKLTTNLDIANREYAARHEDVQEHLRKIGVREGDQIWPGEPEADPRGYGLLKVLLDDPKYPGNGGVVVAHPQSVEEYNASITDRDGARDRRYRLWQGHCPIGLRCRLP